MEAIYEVAKMEYALAAAAAAAAANERLDRFRTVLEPYIFHYLIEHNMEKLNAFWRDYLPPLQYKYAFVIVERRPHPNFDFILKNIAWAGNKYAVYIFCSDINEGFIKALLGDKAGHYNIKVVFTGLGTRDSGKKEYNKFLTDALTYRMINAEYILTVQMDTIFRRVLPDEIFTGVYWGNPWAWKTGYAGGGGATVRRVADMINICSLYKYENDNEDSWLADRIHDTGLYLPPLDFRANMIMESMPVNDPYILHQF